MPRKKRMMDEVTKENKNVDYLESRYMYEARQAAYIANETINQVFDMSDIPEFIEKWQAGAGADEIREYFGMDEWEFKMLVIDLLHSEKINGQIIVVRGNVDGI